MGRRSRAHEREPEELSRRGFLATAAGAGALAAVEWTPIFRVPAASAATSLPTPPAFPAGISLYQQAYEN